MKRRLTCVAASNSLISTKDKMCSRIPKESNVAAVIVADMVREQTQKNEEQQMGFQSTVMQGE